MKLDVHFCTVIIAAIVSVTVLTVGRVATAQEYNALAECRSQSLELDEIHACMDGYLDTQDGNMQAITDYLAESLSGDALVGLGLAQQTFEEYRRENCLWYLKFSSPRNEAEQIAKNCLAEMTTNRLQELQDLVTADKDDPQTVEGFYVYSVDRNYFQPCGQTERYWVEGEAESVDLLQQTYLTTASNDRQLMHAVMVGKLNEQLQAPDGHAGVLELDALVELRVPTDSDCSLPELPPGADISAPVINEPDTVREVFDDELAEQDEPEQQLTAYFSEWIVDCIELAGQRSCKLEVSLTQEGDEITFDRGSLTPKLVINRTLEQGTFIQVAFPGREIESPTLIHWQIDEESLGDIVGSKIRVDRFEARLLVNESEFLVDELMPLLKDGNQVTFSVLEAIDDSDGDEFIGSLQGLTKALAFADDFMRDEV